jgi:hypothetical protein
MDKSRIPGFTAEVSLVASTKRWVALARLNGDKRGVVPQQCEYDEENNQVCCCYHGYCWCKGGLVPWIRQF